MVIQAQGPATVDALAGRWRTARRVVVFTGAGMSTESGLADFRSNNGLWKQNRRFEQLASLDGLRDYPEEFDEFYRLRIQGLRDVSPHAGHLALADLERDGRVDCVITQNVDGLHQVAGSVRVLELHGSLRTVRCYRCAAQTDLAVYLSAEGAWCNRCGGKNRPGVVLFGESLDPRILEEAVSAARNCDLFVVLGSSLQVSPANSLPKLALAAGAELAIVNQDTTPLSAQAVVNLETRVGPALAEIQRTLSS
jgi:NAD-dependent deacetylase